MSRTIRVSVVFITILLVSLIGVVSLRAEPLAQAPRPPRESETPRYPHTPLFADPQMTGPTAPVATDYFGAWSKLVFQSYRDGNWEIYSADGYHGGVSVLNWPTWGAGGIELRPDQTPQLIHTGREHGGG